MVDVTDELRHQAEEFAGDLTTTVRAVVGPHVEPFLAVAAGSTAAGTTRLVVRQAETAGIELNVESVPMLRLTSSFRCVWDHAEVFLAVESSEIRVTAIPGSSEPLFRYDYVRSPTGGVPSGHVQVHAHRDAFTFVMARCGTDSRRGKARAGEVEQGVRVPQVSDLHFPVGGQRFRPCLEDVLQMLLDEFGVERIPGAQQALDGGRAKWRRSQVGASVRDSPETAAATLRVLGYSVQPPPAGPLPDRDLRLREF